jgi:signal transduction histidine kinase/ligand-binding sensor domain-containing protein/DNA-binding response OmpR family regulator
MLSHCYRYSVRHFFVCLLLIQWSSILAVENGQLFNNLKVKDGLPVNEIFTIGQDTTGFMWFGTINGFLRYDGYDMKLFRQDGTGKIVLPDNQITSLANDNQLGLWIGCYEGLMYFDTRTNESRLIDLGKPREVRCLLLQNDSLLWVGTSEGLIELNTKNLSFKLYNEENSALGSNIVRSLYVDSNNNLWIGTFDGLNLLLQKKEMLYFNLKGSYKPELKNNLVLDIQPYTKGNDSFLWIGTETGLVLFNRNTCQTTVYNSLNSGFGNEVVKCILPLEAGQLYFGTDFGFYYFNSKTNDCQVSLHDPFNNYSLANNVVWDIFQDKSGLIWLATANGVSQLNAAQRKFRFTPVFNKIGNLQVGNQVNDIFCDNAKTVWLATKNGVLAHHADGKIESFTNDKNSKFPLVFNNINTISGDKLGRIWIGSAGGINIWEPKSNKMHTITASFDLSRGLRSNYISAFITPADGSFWVTTWGGGMYKAKGDFSTIDEIYFDYIGDFNTNVFSSDTKIWLENKGKLINIDLSTNQIDLPQQLNTFIDNRDIKSLLVSSKGTLWLGINNQLAKYNTRTEEISTYEIILGKDSYINNLTEDFNGDIWGTTLTTVFKFITSTNAVELYPMNKGIPLDIFLSQSICKSRTGELFIGGNDGYISFNPSEISKNAYCPKTVISSIKVNNNPVESFSELKGRNKSKNLVPYSEKLILKYDQHSFSIGFSALHFGDPHRNIYAYMLEGYDKDWNYTSGLKNFATYSNLKPHKYLFKVKGTNNDGVWFENAATLQIVVKPPTWASAWAIAIYIVLLQLGLFSLFVTYRNKVKWKAEIDAITREKEKNDELATAKQQFFTNISHEFRTPLNLIMGPIQTVQDKYNLEPGAKSLLQLVSKNSRRLLSLVNQLMDIRKIENKTLKLNLQPTEIVSLCHEQFDLFVDYAANQKIEFRLEAPAKEINLITDPVKLESIIQNLLSNAFKFTPQNGQILFKLEVPDTKLIKITVSDTGAGIAPEELPHLFDRFFQGKNSSDKQAGYGIGLNLAKEYCELMNGQIRIESQPAKGSVFTVELPLTSSIQGELHLLNEQKTITSERVLKELKSVELIGNTTLPVILLVDDHPDTISFIKISLAGKYHFITASNGKEALTLLEKHSFNLIISDVMMPEIGGLTLCERVKANPKHSSIPIILLTAMTMASHHIEGYRAGADDYLIKPFNTDVLEARIESLLHRSRKIEEYIKQQMIVGNQDIEVESHNEKLLQETIKFINAHISDTEINIDKMCKAIGVSHSSLYRKIKVQTGLTLNELIRQVKLKRAAQLIKNKKMTIAEIMDETGFTNHSYFAKCFKKEYGLSPREWAEKR